jgi:hypothetical protein
MNRFAETVKKYFVPDDGNGNKPHLLRESSVLFVVMIVMVVELAFVFSTSYIIPRSKLFGVIEVSALIDGTNAARVTANIPPLTENALLDAAAQDKANDMVANNYFAHTSPSGITPWYWFNYVGYNFSTAGENLAVNFDDSSDVTTAWMNSPEHRENILNAGFTQIGMATAQGTYEGQPAIYVVELFGTPVPSFGFGETASAATLPPATTTPAAAKPPAAPAPVKKLAGVASAVKTAPANTTSVVAQTQNFIEVTGTAAAAASAGTTTVQAVPNQANLVQTAAGDPVETVDYFFFAIAGLFGIALIVNIFVKIHIQYRDLILGGMLVILITGLFIVLNQHAALASAVIL